jgi:hypothetical protein
LMERSMVIVIKSCLFLYDVVPEDIPAKLCFCLYCYSNLKNRASVKSVFGGDLPLWNY